MVMQEFDGDPVVFIWIQQFDLLTTCTRSKTILQTLCILY